MGQGVALTQTGRLAAILAVAALLSGCGSEKSGPSPVGQALGTIAKETIGRVRAKRAQGGQAAAAPAPVTRADLEKFGIPILRVVIPARAADGLLTITDDKGSFVTWSTTDGTTFTLRDGIVVQTRGLGPDLMSSEAPTVQQLLTDGATYQRLYFFLGENDQTTRRTYDCTVTVGGPESIEIFSKAHTVTKVTELCARSLGNITNTYWFEGTTIRKSQQWISGRLAYIDFERVVD
jgi:Group 4 capsule polysaccharide lipoprotein gfcB, YjbF